MQQSLRRSHSFFWLPYKAFVNKINKIGILASIENVFNFFGSRSSYETFLIRFNFRFKINEKFFTSATFLYKLLGWNIQYLHKHCNLLIFIFAWENRNSLIKLYNYTSQWPHIDCASVGNSQNDLGCPIITALDISIHLLLLIATAPNINYFYSCFVFLL